MIEVKTEHPLALDIVDHLYPDGIFFDNVSNSSYISQVEARFGGRKINMLDLGCGGGQLVVDFYNRGHTAVGLDGSDFALKNNMHNWPTYYQKCLFNADLRYPFQILEDGGIAKFDFINSWEVIEHIPLQYLETFFVNVLNHLAPGGFFAGSVATLQNSRLLVRGEGPPSPDFKPYGAFWLDTVNSMVYGPWAGDWGKARPIKAEEVIAGDMIEYHHTLFPADWWVQTMSPFFQVFDYPFAGVNRMGSSYHFMLTHK